MLLGHKDVMLFIVTVMASLLITSCIENPRCADLNITSPRVAIVFYGLSRSLRSTLPSFEKYVFGVLDKQGIAYDVFWSGLDSSYIDNKRSNETHMQLDTAEFMSMRPCVFTVVSQSIVYPAEFKLYLQSRLEFTRKMLDMFKDGLQSVKNLLGALHSLRTAHSMIIRYAKAQSITYDAVIVLRPDTAVVSEIDIAQNLPQIVAEEQAFKRKHRGAPQSLWIPDFEPALGYNDRAAYGSLRAMSVYMTRLVALRDRAGPYNGSYFNGETFLHMYLRIHDITVHPSALRVIRVRADSSVARLDTIQLEMNMDDAAYQHYTQNCLYYKMKKVPCRTFMCDWLEPPKWERVDETAYYSSVNC